MSKTIFIILGLIFFLGSGAMAAPGGPVTGNNQVMSRDVIGLRVVPNPEHLSPMQWYEANIKIKGSPQGMIIDGYDAVRDGRTVYVNAAKISKVNRCNGTNTVCTTSRECIQLKTGILPDWLIPAAWAAGNGACEASSIPELYTNIYIISFNQDPEAATNDIFGQLLQFWKFNPELKNCSGDPDRYCTDGAECSAATAPGSPPQSCEATGLCSKTATQSCLLDSDCPNNEFCRNKKSAVIRDVRRLADMFTMKKKLEDYNKSLGRYPLLDQGTYLTGRTISTWPSWQETFRNALGGFTIIDPINSLSACTRNGAGTFNPATCWDEAAKAYSATPNPLALPMNGTPKSYAYYYQYQRSDNSFRFCGITESGFVNGLPTGSPLCKTNDCASCSGRQCGGNGCGVSCGTCASGLTCNREFKCVVGGIDWTVNQY